MTEDNLFCYAKDENKDGFQKNRYRIFNKDVDKDLYFEELKKSRELLKYFKLCFFVKEEIMTEEEKKNNEKYKTIGGFLKVLKYEEAWKIWWRNLSEENKNRMKELKNFDKEIFKNITGIDIEEKLVEVTCNGKTTKITKEKAIDLKLI